MKIYELSISGFETYSPVILYHHAYSDSDFEALVKKGFLEVIKSIVESNNEEEYQILFSEFILRDLVVDYLIREYCFIKPEICEFELNEFSIFSPLYLGKNISLGDKRQLPYWIPNDLQEKMFKVTKKFSN